MKLEFTKMEGLGNDYIYVDAERFAQLSRVVADGDRPEAEIAPGGNRASDGGNRSVESLLSRVVADGDRPEAEIAPGGNRASDGGNRSVESLLSRVATLLSDRHFGIGSDGLVLIGRSSVADFSMRMFNADGSEGMMCGNAARCIGKYVYDNGLTDSTEITLETRSGIKRLSLHLGTDGSVESVSVDMGTAEIVQQDLELEAGGLHFRGIVVNVGNPHFVILCDEAEDVELERIGPLIEQHPIFPGRTNVEFVSLSEAKDTIRMRVWERGSGITLACGTGACATAAALVGTGVVSSPCAVVMDGGTLTISCSPAGAILMTGPARTVFRGTVEI